MSTLLTSPPLPFSLKDVASISKSLADDISRLVLRTEGFSVEGYLSLEGAYFVEYKDGCLQVLPTPTAFHQAIAFVFANLLLAWSKGDSLARTKLAPFRVRLGGREFREPDVCFMLGKNSGRRNDQFWEGADLVVEVVSASNREHDYRTKHAEYAAGRIPEYWLIDPELKAISVFILQGDEYAPHGQFGIGQIADGKVLGGFSVNVGELFAEAAAQA